MALGELVLESNGKITGIRVLSDGKLEVSYQGSGKLLGVEAAEFYTAVSSSQPGGASLLEGNGILSTRNGDSAFIKFSGVGRSTGAGFKGNLRGGTVWQTSSPKLSKLNNAASSWEVEVDETGNYHLKVWEWK